MLSRVPLQALYVLVNLHLESSIKSSCCVVPHQALYVTLHIQNSIKKLSFVSPYTLHLMALLSILEQTSHCEALPLEQPELPTDTPAS